MGTLRHLNDVLEGLSGRRLVRPDGARGASVGASGAARRHLVELHSQLERRLVYSALAELRSRSGEIDERSSVDLRLAELKVFSQNGEDGVIETLLRTLDIRSKFFVEFGVEDGSECNTRLLAEVLGWTGVYFEPDERGHAALEQRYRHNTSVTCTRCAVTPGNVTGLFRDAGVPERFGVLSIDVDGQDYLIWEALDPVYRPALVVIECNSGYDLEEVWVEPRGRAWSKEFPVDFGASIGAIRELGLRLGYQLVHVDLCGVNAFLVADEFMPSEARRLVGQLVRSPNYFLEGRDHAARRSSE